jgi:ribonuclease HI
MVGLRLTQMERVREGRTIAGCGGVMKNSSGVWIGGFAKHVGVYSAFTAELWGILEGLKYTWYKGFRFVKLDVDPVAVVQAIKSGATTSVNGISLIRSICRLFDQV